MMKITDLRIVGYKLDGHTPVPVYDIMEWGEWFNTAERHVGDTLVRVPFKKVRVSTVFLALDHRFDEGTPILFETMIFGGRHDQYCERYATWEEAEEGHKRIVKQCKEWWKFWKLWNV